MPLGNITLGGMLGVMRALMWWILPSAAGIRNVSSTWATTRRPATAALVTMVNVAWTRHRAR